MRNALLIISVLSAALFSAACGGGGGGGTTGGNAGYLPEQVSKINSVFAMGTKTQEHLSHSTAEAAGYAITKTADGLTLVRTGYIDNRTINFSALKDDFADDPNHDYLLAMRQTTGRVSAGAPGSYVAIDAVRLGGKKLGLRYADFGSWATNVTYTTDDGTGNGLPSSDGSNTPFYMGDADKKANFSASSGTISFTGKTLAAYNTSLLMEGSANLSINTASLANSDFVLSFPDFYDFHIPVGVGADGKITGNMGGATHTANTASPRDTIHGVYSSGYVDGQFYGDAPGNPTEAAGTYLMHVKVYDSIGQEMWRGLNGSFGLKRR